MNARWILSAVVVASLSGCASLAEDIIDGLAEAAVESVFAIALSPFDDDDKKHHTHEKHKRVVEASYAPAPAPAPLKSREKGVQQ